MAFTGPKPSLTHEASLSLVMFDAKDALFTGDFGEQCGGLLVEVIAAHIALGQGADDQNFGCQQLGISRTKTTTAKVELSLLVRQPAERAEVGLVCLDFEQQVGTFHVQHVGENVH